MLIFFVHRSIGVNSYTLVDKELIKQVWDLTYLCFTLLIGRHRGGTSVQDIKYASLKDCGFATFSGKYDNLIYS